MKTCSKCKVEKELTEFHKDSKGKYGVRKICKDCVHKYYVSNRGKPTKEDIKMMDGYSSMMGMTLLAKGVREDQIKNYGKVEYFSSKEELDNHYFFIDSLLKSEKKHEEAYNSLISEHFDPQDEPIYGNLFYLIGSVLIVGLIVWTILDGITK
jgi:hypothetical protein